MFAFRQLFDPQSSTYTYLLADADSKDAILIDPVFEQAARDAALVRELGLTLRYCLDTHVHADHVTAAWLHRHQAGAQIAVAKAGGAEGADVGLTDGDIIRFGGRYVTARATPGHTNGCMTFVLDDESMAFTGDCLLIRGCGRTDFQQGSAQTMFRSIHDQIFSLPDDCLLYPAHDYRGLTVTSVTEEKQFNPRIGGQLSEQDFVGYMDNLGLPHPKQIAIALPANLRCGRPSQGEGGLTQAWGPAIQNFAGIWEVEPYWVEEHLADVTVVDVREPDEFSGPLGHIPGAILIPLGELNARAAELPGDRPLVTVCRAGGRSAQATSVLAKHGYQNLANLAGGMLRWLAEKRLAEGAAE
ncbi:MAG: MBL fold metallo-hydrolase [Gammaproteobacteria bacterium]|nr:MBL fold metallo-hydrolase [Gammaproteobacteria bacterium]